MQYVSCSGESFRLLVMIDLRMSQRSVGDRLLIYAPKLVAIKAVCTRCSRVYTPCVITLVCHGQDREKAVRTQLLVTTKASISVDHVRCATSTLRNAAGPISSIVHAGASWDKSLLQTFRFDRKEPK